MAFKIIKRGANDFWHNNGFKEVNLSDWEIILESVGQTVVLEAKNGANFPQKAVGILDVIVIDETASSLEETFTNVEDLRLRLVALGYNPYIVGNGGGGSTPSLYPYIRITDKNGDVFTTLAEARTYLDIFTDTSLFTNEAFNADSGIYQFTCPEGTSLAGSDDFCGSVAENLRFEDKWNLITEFGNLAFAGNFENNEFAEYWGVNGLITTTFGNSCFDTCGGSNKLYGKYIFGDNAFANAGGETNEKRGQYINYLEECGVNFASSYLGSFEILTWGASIASDIFTTSEIVIVKTPYANKYNNAGGINATVQIVIDNLALGNPNSVVSFDGVDELSFTPENVANKTDTMAGNTASSTKYLSAKGVYDYIVSLAYLTIASASATYQTLASFASDVRSTVLTGFTGVAGKVTSSDSILSAINKIVGNIALKVDKSRYVFQGKTSITGVTIETVIFSFKIPAGAYAASDSFSFDITGYKSVTASSVEYRTYIGTAANALTTQIGRFIANAATRTFDYNRKYHLDSGTLDCSTGFTSNAVNGFAQTIAVNTPATANASNDIWITVTGNPSVSSEVIGILSASITPLK